MTDLHDRMSSVARGMHRKADAWRRRAEEATDAVDRAEAQARAAALVWAARWVEDEVNVRPGEADKAGPYGYDGPCTACR